MINIEYTPIFKANMVNNHIIGALKEEQNSGMEQVFKNYNSGYVLKIRLESSF